MLTFNQFKEHMDFLKMYKDKQNKVSAVLNEYNRDFLELAGFITPYEEQLEKLLAQAMAGEVGEKLYREVAEWISWYIYDTNFGKNKDMAKVYIPVGNNKKKTINVADIKIFYLFLEQTINEQNED